MVRLIDADGSQVGIVSNARQSKADAAGMDLVMMETVKHLFEDHGLRQARL